MTSAPPRIPHALAALVLACASIPALADDSANTEYRSDFSDFQPVVRFGICHNSFLAEVNSLRQLLSADELFTSEGHSRLQSRTEAALYRAGLTGARSWHLTARAAKFAKSYAELQEQPLNEFCHQWFDEQEKSIEATELDTARKVAQGFVQELTRKAAEASSSKKDST